MHLDGDTILGNRGQGLEVAQAVLGVARLNLSAKAIGGSKRCLQLLHRFATRRSIGTGLLWDNAVTVDRTVELVRELDAVEGITRVLAHRLDSGQGVPGEALMACKVEATEMLWRAVHEVSQALGG